MKIEDLTDKIYREGIDKARQEREAILETARAEATALTESARTERESILAAAREEAKQARERLQAEIAVAASQAVSLLKQRITDMLAEAAIAPAVHAAAADPRFIQSLILEVVSRWAPSDARLDLALVLPEERKGDLEAFFETQAAALLSRGMTVEFRSRMPGGFVIGPKDGSFKLSFLEPDLVRFFKSFLRDKTRRVLFGDGAQ
jgi:V/A-type H+-transporting ATPase subunit E